jgi:hypothetical protein
VRVIWVACGPGSRAGPGYAGALGIAASRRDPEFTASDDTLVVAQTFRLAGD